LFDILSLIQVGFARALKYRQNIRVQRKSCLKFLIGGLIGLVSFGFMLFQPASTPHHTGFAALSIMEPSFLRMVRRLDAKGSETHAPADRKGLLDHLLTFHHKFQR